MMKIQYKGFSTHNYATLGGTFSMTDIDLVNMDILSHIYTEKRDRVMMPTYGTGVTSSAHEMLTDELVENIKDDLTTVINADPRVEKIRLVITPYYDSNSLVATLTLRYVELDVVDDLNFVINIDTGN